jgi:hypothetical protein
MAILFYLFRAFALMRCAVDSHYRQQTAARWKSTRPHIIVFEIGGGLIGLLILSGLALWIVMVTLDGR